MSDINIVLEQRDDIHVAVEEKDINVEVPAGKDGRSLHPQGEWSASAAYAYLDLVSYEGSSYVATKAVPAGTLPTDTSYWMLSAEKGGPGTPAWGTITGDLSDQTDLQTALDAKADVILSNASGSIASFSDGSPAPVTALSVSIEPVQDLHGYDNPWPAGGGKNLFPDKKYQNSTTTVVLGQNTSFDTREIYLPIGTYTVSYTISSSNAAGIYYRDSVDNTNHALANRTYSGSFTVTEAQNYVFWLYRSGGLSIDEVLTFQIESGSSATSWTPYSNICPISGHTSATVTRTGRNLCPQTGWEVGQYQDGVWTGNTTPNRQTTGEFISIKPNTTYTMSIDQNGTADLAWINYNYFDANKNWLGNRVNNGQGVISGNRVVTFNISNPNARFVKLTVRKFSDASGNISSVDISTGTPQLELGSTSTEYEAPSVQTVTIDLDGTRYGGVLDVLTGELTVTHRTFTLNGSNTGLKKQQIGTTGHYRIRFYVVGSKSYSAGTTFSGWCDTYKPESADATYQRNMGIAIQSGQVGYLYDTQFDNSTVTEDEIKNYYNTHPVTVVYELASPLTVQLSPSQMQTLLGQNNIFADTGDVAVTYRADTKLFIEGQIAQTAKVTRQMIADSATADGKAPKSLATGDLIIVGDELRKATANIGNGSAITASNSTTATLADVIKALQ